MAGDLESLIMSAGDLPTIPVVALKVMQLIEQENINADELAKVVSSDPAVAARVLKLSNSSFYGCQRQIQTLSHAIMMLGFPTLKSVVVASSLKQVYKSYGLTEKMLWEHSSGAGIAARVIASSLRAVNVEEAFLGGLFHDIGKIVMNTVDNRQFQIIMERCYNEHIPFSEAEYQEYPYTHAEVGALVVRKWNFPELLVKAVLEHHTFGFSANEDPYQVRLTCVVGLAHLFCEKIGAGVWEPDEELVLHESRPAQLLGIDEENMAQLYASFIEAYEENKNNFS